MPNVEGLEWSGEEEEQPVYTKDYAPYAPYAEFVEKYAGDYGVPADYARAVMETESSYRPNVRSSQGARGLYQITPVTAEYLGVDYEELDDPETNIDAGIRYLGKLLNRYDGDREKASAAYNWGPGNLARHGLENRPKETRGHWDKIRLNMMRYAKPDGTLPGMWMGGQVGRTRYR